MNIYLFIYLLVFGGSVLMSYKTECYSDLDHNLSLLILPRFYTQYFFFKGNTDTKLSDPVSEIPGNLN